MNDRELIELAAKAAGITGTWAEMHQAYGDQIVTGLNTGSQIYWNPLTDDGDALRLAVKLRIELSHMAMEVFAGRNEAVCVEPNDDPYAATRRAIVRAAAEIGRNNQ